VSETKKKKASKMAPKRTDKKRELLMYVLDRKTRQRVGVVVAIQRGQEVRLGWSKCMVRPSMVQISQGITKPDVFDRDTGKNKARGRAKQKALLLIPNGQSYVSEIRAIGSEVPYDCRVALRKLGRMAHNYFKK
jgi:hypothetical protein